MHGSSHCDVLTDTLKPAPSGASGPVYVGPALGQYPTAEMECQVQSNQKYKCFNAYSLRSVAPDIITNYKVYVAYMASSPPVPDVPGIYFTRSAGGSNWGLFTDRVLIAQNSTNSFVYDPQVTVDSDGTITVS